MVPDRAASILNPRPDDEGAENFGGSIRVKGEAVLRRFKIPILFRVGERPAGADSGDDFEMVVFKRVAWDRAARIGRRGEVVGFRDEKLLGAGGEGGAFVRK